MHVILANIVTNYLNLGVVLVKSEHKKGVFFVRFILFLWCPLQIDSKVQLGWEIHYNPKKILPSKTIMDFIKLVI